MVLRIETMSFSKRLLIAPSLLLLYGCGMGPDPGAPRAPLPSEIKTQASKPSAGMPGPRSLSEVRKELDAKKAKKAADESAAKGDQAGATTPVSDTPATVAPEAGKASDSKPTPPAKDTAPKTAPPKT